VAEQTGVAQGLMAFSRGVGMICGPLLMSKLLGKLKLGERAGNFLMDDGCRRQIHHQYADCRHQPVRNMNMYEL
jgi:hypothetical protein